MVKYAPLAPIAQWIERRPPEPKTRVRVAVGVPNENSRLRILSSGFWLQIRFDNGVICQVLLV